MERLQVPYREISLYLQAFVHRSVLNERITRFVEHNERLEFLGDAVLELAATEYLYHHFPQKTEGEMTDIRSALVRGDSIARVSLDLGFSEYIVLSKGEMLSGGNRNPFILADTIEALLGAMYLDVGYVAVRTFLEVNLFPYVDTIEREALHIDPKSKLQEVTQAKYQIIPRYSVIAEEGMDHKKTYTVGAMIAERTIGIGRGQSKKRAETDAAKNALERVSEWGENPKK